MDSEEQITNLQQMLDRIEQSATGQERVTLYSITEAVGNRSFGPLLLLAGVIMASPLTAFPSVPTMMGLLVFIIAVQLLFRKKYFWLPNWLLRRSMASSKFIKGIEWLRPFARFVDRWLRPRLTLFVRGINIYIIALACVAIALSMPVMELVPLSAHIAGLALTAFGLSLIARDGLLALLAFIATAATFGLIIYNLL
jgi:hypothetical protein